MNEAQKSFISFGKVSVCNEMIKNLLKESIDRQFYEILLHHLEIIIFKIKQLHYFYLMLQNNL